MWDARTDDGGSFTKAVSGRELQDIAAAAAEVIPEITRGVAKRVRMEAGEPAAAYVHRSVKELHRDLPAEIETLRAKEAALTARIGKLEADGRELTQREANLNFSYQVL